MPIKLPKTLPAFSVLRSEGVMVMSDHRAINQDIRPLRIALLNLMPKKIQTEIQFSRLIGATPLQIELSLMRMSEHVSKTTSSDHIDEFYRSFESVAQSGEKFDGLIVTGAPIEHLPYEDVTYWPELQQVFNWAQTNVHMNFGVCWGGMAMLYHYRGIPKHALNAKAFGCFRHENLNPVSPYLRGFSDDMVMPVSRWTEIKRDEIIANSALSVLIDSTDVGPCLVEDPSKNALYIFNHLEYDNGTLEDEYKRDLEAGGEITIPVNYFPDDDPTLTPRNCWRSHAHLLFGNWINQIYQTTPFDQSLIGATAKP